MTSCVQNLDWFCNSTHEVHVGIQRIAVLLVIALLGTQAGAQQDALRDNTDLVERFAGEEVGSIERRHSGAAHDLKIAGDHDPRGAWPEHYTAPKGTRGVMARFAAFSSLSRMRELPSV